jgi:hypothetical protein
MAVRPSDLGKLTDAFSGEIVRPDDPGYDSARVVWNSMIDRRPALIVRCRSWARAAADTAEPHATVGRYVNDVTEAGGDVARMIYGTKYERLVALKRAWDPANVFRLNQNIAP